MHMKVYFFSETYHSALVQTARLCAVKKHLENPPEFNVFVTAKGLPEALAAEREWLLTHL